MSITERRLTGVLVTLLAVCLIAAAASALLLGRSAAVAQRPSQPATPSMSAPADRPEPTSAATRPAPSGPATTSSSTPASSSRPAPTTAPSAPATPTSASSSAAPSSAPPATAPSGTAELDPPVELSAQAANHPDAAAIALLVSRNFKSINTLDYQLWADTVTPEQSEALGPEDWLEAYRTSKDRNIEIVAIEPDTRWITMTFNSSQAVEKAPTDARSTCLDWKVVRPVVTVNGKLRLAKSVEGMSSYRGCE